MKLKFNWKFSEENWQRKATLNFIKFGGIVVFQSKFSTWGQARIRTNIIDTADINYVNWLIEALIDANTIMQEWNKEMMK